MILNFTHKILQAMLKSKWPALSSCLCSLIWASTESIEFAAAILWQGKEFGNDLKKQSLDHIISNGSISFSCGATVWAEDS